MGKNGDLIYKWVEDNDNNNNINDEEKDNENSDSLEFILVFQLIFLKFFVNLILNKKALYFCK